MCENASPSTVDSNVFQSINEGFHRPSKPSNSAGLNTALDLQGTDKGEVRPRYQARPPRSCVFPRYIPCHDRSPNHSLVLSSRHATHTQALNTYIHYHKTHASLQLRTVRPRCLGIDRGIFARNVTLSDDEGWVYAR